MTSSKSRLSWWPAIAAYMAAVTFPCAFLHYFSTMFESTIRMPVALILILWLGLACWSLGGIALCVARGSKRQQLVALLSIPAFVPIAAFGFAVLYLFRLF